MQNRVERVNVGVMMAGQGRVADVFAATASFMKERKRKEEEALRAKRRYSPAQEEARRWVAVIGLLQWVDSGVCVTLGPACMCCGHVTVPIQACCSQDCSHKSVCLAASNVKTASWGNPNFIAVYFTSFMH